MGKLTAKDVKIIHDSYCKTINGKLDLNNPIHKSQVFKLLSCYEKYLFENIKSTSNFKFYISIYNHREYIKSLVNDYYKGKLNYKNYKEVMEEWNKYCLIVKKNNKDLSSPEVLEQERVLLGYVNKYLNNIKFMNKILDNTKKIYEIKESVSKARNSIDKSIENAKNAKETKYYIVNVKDTKKIETIYENSDYEDESYSYKKEVRVVDNSLDFYDYKSEPFLYSVRIFAIKDENSLREIVTGKKIYKWPDISKATSLPSQDYIYCDSLDPVDEIHVSSELGIIINNKNQNVIQEYKNRLAKKQNEYISRYQYYVDRNKFDSETKKRSLTNLEKLRNYKPKN